MCEEGSKELRRYTSVRPAVKKSCNRRVIGMSRRSRKAAAARDGAKWQAPLESALRKHLAPALGRGPHAEVVVAQCLGAATAAVDQKEYALFFYAPSSGLLFACLVVIGLVAVVLYFFTSASDEGGDEDGRKGQGKPVELLALFSNPALPKEAARFGLRPLAFGQDLKLLLHALPASDIDVEPAATLLSAQQALVRSSPRFLLFSGHTILEALAFESEDGRLDLHADPSFFVTLLETLNVEHERAVAAAAPAKRWTPDAKAAVYSRKREMRTAAVPPPLLREGMPSEGTVSRASPGSAPPAVARTATAPSSVRVAPLVERAVGLFAHLDDLKVAAAQKIQRYARGHLVRAQTRATFDAFFSTRGGKAARRKKVEKSAALEVSALVERFRERLGVEPPSRPRSEALARLRCVVLNGCQTDEIGRSLVRALPRLAVVCWQSVAEDSAARAFAVGFYAAVAEQLQERTRYKKMMRRAWPRLLSLLLPRRTARYLFGADPEETASSWTHECAVRAFEAGCYAFVSAGFHFVSRRRLELGGICRSFLY